MTTKKRSITFYGSPPVCEWYEKLDPGEGSRRVNRAIEEMLKTETERVTVEGRLDNIEEALKQLLIRATR